MRLSLKGYSTHNYFQIVGMHLRHTVLLTNQNHMNEQLREEKCFVSEKK
jgi:hypothetical protein